MDKEKIIAALKNLELSKYNPNGYSAKEVLCELNMEINEKNEKLMRTELRSWISKMEHSEFKTAGSENIVYCPNGKGTGRYRLAEYQGK